MWSRGSPSILFQSESLSVWRERDGNNYVTADVLPSATRVNVIVGLLPEQKWNVLCKGGNVRQRLWTAVHCRRVTFSVLTLMTPIMQSVSSDYVVRTIEIGRLKRNRRESERKIPCSCNALSVKASEKRKLEERRPKCLRELERHQEKSLGANVIAECKREATRTGRSGGIFVYLIRPVKNPRHGAESL